MKIQQFQPVFRPDVPQAPPWIEKFLAPMNDQLRKLTVMAQGQITDEDNLNSEVRDLKIRHDEWAEVSLKKLRGKPIGVSLEFWDFDEYGRFKWQVLDIDRIKFKVKWDTNPAREVLVRIIVKGK